MAKAKTLKYESNPFKVIFTGFSNLFNYNQTMAIVILFVTLFGSFWQLFGYGFGGGGTAPATTSTSAGTQHVNIIPIIIALAIVGLVVGAIALFIQTVVQGAIAFVIYKTSKGQKTDLNETMSMTFKKFWTIFWIQVIVFFKVFGGLILFIIPGVRAMLRYNLVLLPVFDENLSSREAVARCKAITKDHLIEVFGMVVAAGIIPLVGPIMQIGGRTVMYPQLKHLKDTGSAKPKVHWLNYLGFILVAVVTLMMFMIIGLIVLAIKR